MPQPNPQLTLNINDDWILDYVKKKIEAGDFNFDDLLDRAKLEAETLVDQNIENLITDIYTDTSEEDGFRSRLKDIWGGPIAGLKLLYKLSILFGTHLKSLTRDNGEASSLMIRMHARGCLILQEIICLLENGLADGANARWRSLHELYVTATFISQHYSDNLAQRYMDHAIVESIRGMRELEQHHDALGYEPCSGEDLKWADDEQLRLVTKYGKRFYDEPNGWAAEVIKKEFCSFAAVERATDLGHWRPYYRMASHALAKPLFWQLGARDANEVLLAGRSDYGLTDPGQMAALEFANLTTTLLTFQHHGFTESHVEMVYFAVIMSEVSHRTRDAFVECGQTFDEGAKPVINGA